MHAKGISPDLLAAAYAGDAEAQVSVASSYKHGIRVAKDFDMSVAFYRKAAEQGHAEAQEALLEFYYYGEEIPKDYAEAAFWARRGAAQGHAYAQLWLGSFYEKGEVLPQDYLLAAIWYREAADAGFSNAQWFLGLLYGKGLGVPQDYVQAYFWQSLAVAGWKSWTMPAHEKYVSELDGLRTKLDDGELSAIERRTNRWYKDHPLQTLQTQSSDQERLK
jgi:TPR repeat protein